VTQKTTALHDTPVPESQTQSLAERDTLNDTPELRFLRDEIEALLGSASVRRAVREPAINYAEQATPEDAALQSDEITEEISAELDRSVYDRDTEPSVDVQLLREAARAAGSR
jgi:hypothetical protein